MSQIKAHMKWCLADKNRLIKTKPNLELAQKHLKKSEYNHKIVQSLERMKIYDWALRIVWGTDNNIAFNFNLAS